MVMHSPQGEQDMGLGLALGIQRLPREQLSLLLFFQHSTQACECEAISRLHRVGSQKSWPAAEEVTNHPPSTTVAAIAVAAQANTLPHFPE
jgi:hypothetical protein